MVKAKGIAKKIYKLKGGNKMETAKQPEPTTTAPVTTLVPVEPAAIVMPAVSTDEAVKQWQAYQDLKSKITEKEDIQQIQGRDFLKKSYWRKLATFFNLTVKIISEKVTTLPDGNMVYDFVDEATAPNGRSATGTGTCDLLEKGGRKNTMHNARGTAETRAFNRAVSNLVGGGEVSADEVIDDNNGNGHSNGNGYHNAPSNGNAAPADKPTTPQPKDPNAPATEKQFKYLMVIADKKGVSIEQIKGRSVLLFKKESSKQLTMGEMSQLIDHYSKMPDKATDEPATPTPKSDAQAAANAAIKTPPDIEVMPPEGGEFNPDQDKLPWD